MATLVLRVGHRYNAAMKRLWIAWAIAGAVVVVTAFVPGLRDETRLEWATLPPLRDAFNTRAERRVNPLAVWFKSFRKGPMQAAARRHTGDPELMSAAGSLLLPPEAGLSALRQAAQASHSPVLWSAYADTLLDSGIAYERVATAGVDPGRPAEIAEVERVLAQRHIPTALTPRQVQPLLDALQAWRRADPDNGLPLAVEAWCLYGLHRDAEALARWQEAARRKKVDSYHGERTDAARRVLVEVGYPESEAVVVADTLRPPALERLQSMVRIAMHEGRRAQLAGRARDGIEDWQATRAVGRHLQDSAATFVTFATGADVEASGAAPAWVWVEGSQTRGRGMEPNGGCAYYGPQHTFYAEQVGAAADAQVRDGLITSKLRMNMLRRLAEVRDEPQWYPRAGDVLAFGQMLLVFMLGAAALALVAALAGRGGAPALRSPWHLVIALPALVVLALGAGVTTALAVQSTTALVRVPAASQFWGSIAAALLAAMLCPLLAALFLRLPDASRLRAWRANLLTGLPVAVAIAAVVFLGSGLAALDLRAKWVRQSVHAGMTEMQMAARFGGDQWRHPRLPPDSWQASEPPR